ncbi:uncharacterized protein LOC116604085 [Nematostella vectensis]|uniref:uncharacterized protein LOC116604085 n=1 Tax=Nematostella vectensis TaxID=45351 RepID=UPI0020771064|nr:uncharacterized protein LOC116604085 [Nematostella vectensis]
MLRLLLVAAVLFCCSEALIDLTDDTLDKCYTSLDPEYIPPDDIVAKKMAKNLLRLRPPGRRQYAAPRRPTDVILVVDSSNSLRRREFHRGLRALEWLINRGSYNTHYAGIVFSFGASVAFPFLPPDIAKRLVRKIPFEAGRTNTQLALSKALVDLLQNNRSNVRPNSIKKVVILSDGQSNIEPEKTLYNGFKLKMLGAEVFVIAVGKKLTGLPELMSLASTTNGHLFRVQSMTGLLHVVRLIPRPEQVRDMDMSWYRKLLAAREKQLASHKKPGDT